MKLGDAAAKAIHVVTGIEPCGGCNQRREALNEFGDQLLSKLDLLRGRGKVEAMTYLVTVNTQKTYTVDAANADEALTKISDSNQTFSATTNNVRLQQVQNISTTGQPTPA